MKWIGPFVFVIAFSFFNLPLYSYSDEPPCTSSDQVQVYPKQVQINQKVDVLWVIDNSSSMNSMQQALKNSILEVMQSLLMSNIDFKMGMVSTDALIQITKTKKLESFSKINFLADQKLFLNEFYKSIMMGVSGSNEERVLDSIVSFIDKSGEFVRNNSKLVVIVLSDNDHALSNAKQLGDQSTITPSEFMNTMNQRVGVDRIKFVSILPEGSEVASFDKIIKQTWVPPSLLFLTLRRPF